LDTKRAPSWVEPWISDVIKIKWMAYTFDALLVFVFHRSVAQMSSVGVSHQIIFVKEAMMIVQFAVRYFEGRPARAKKAIGMVEDAVKLMTTCLDCGMEVSQVFRFLRLLV